MVGTKLTRQHLLGLLSVKRFAKPYRRIQCPTGRLTFPKFWKDFLSSTRRNEPLQLFPTLPITIRVAVRDSYLASYPSLCSTKATICPWAINRNPEFWGSGGIEFKPEGWIDDGKSNNRGGAISSSCQMAFFHGFPELYQVEFRKDRVEMSFGGICCIIAIGMGNRHAA